jgi:tetratricopeptide (TPR) repeat protein
VTRLLAFWAISASLLLSGAPQEPKLKSRSHQDQQPAQGKEQEPPEEDESLKPKEYSFNPLQAQKELRIGNYYFHKGSYKAAVNRFREATKWDPTFADAYFRLGETEEKLKDKNAAKDAYAKYLEMAPDGKEAAAAKKKIAGL